jgi:hypothetical protein
VLSGALTCAGGAHAAMVHPLGPMLAITEYYADNGGCSATPTPIGSGVAYELMPAVAASSVFAEVTRSVE